MSILSIYQVDAFSPSPFKGNPAGVCILDEAISEELMQSIAAEMNLSETAFLLSDESVSDAYHIRYFTPSTEVGLCGHATLASAKVLFSMLRLGVQKLTFYAPDEVLTVQKRSTDLVMNFPQYFTEEIDAVPEDFWEAMQVSGVRDIRYAPSLKILLMELGEGNELLTAQPDYGLLMALDFPVSLEGVILTSHDTRALPQGSAFDFMSRCFFPWIGISEDPVTGVAHTILAPYWAAKLHKSEFRAYQASQRGGELELKLLQNNRLEISGEAHIVLKGDLYLE